MYCPSCKRRVLKPTRVEHGLPALCCTSCGGYLIDILSYRMWSEDKQPGGGVRKVSLEDPADSSGALLCPRCEKIMSKYQINDETRNKIDLCNHCGQFWLDGGEWQLLEALDLQTAIPTIFGLPWQKSIRQKLSNTEYEKKYQKLLGETVYARVREFRDWLITQSSQDKIRDYVNRKEETKQVK